MDKHSLRFFPTFLAVLFVTFFLRASYTQAGTFLFSDNLRLGDSGAGVAELQRLLNKDVATAVAIEGPGSSGNETQYFGTKTQDAVIRFQNKYSSEILIPQGLYSGTGFVGSSTRAKLNLISFGEASSVSPAAGTAPFVPVVPAPPALPTPTPPTAIIPPASASYSQFNFFTEADNATVQLAFMSKNYGKHGSQVEFTGSGFLPTGNKISFDDKIVQNISSVNSNKIIFTIPSSIPAGIYDNVEVSNGKGMSESNLYFVVTDDVVAMPPKIISVSPVEASLGDEITIVGENFTPTGNVVRSSLGLSDTVSSSDGKTLKVTLDAPSELEVEKVFDADSSFKLKVFFYVVNTHGVSGSNNPGIITLRGQ